MDGTFQVGGTGVRRVEPRNAPTIVNAVFNHRNLWDGSANNVFNGSSPWGDRDPDAGVWVQTGPGTVVKQRLSLVNSSLASQALAPPMSDVEMACAGRRFADLGRKLVSRAPLATLLAYRRRMGWTFPWASSAGSDFNFDFSVSFAEAEQRAFGGVAHHLPLPIGAVAQVRVVAEQGCVGQALQGWCPPMPVFRLLGTRTGECAPVLT